MDNEMNYETAFAELEAIYDAINNDRVSVDELTAKVKRAAVLVEFCRSRLSATEDDLAGIVRMLEDVKDGDDTAGGTGKI